jgi:hypothetical protein
MASLSNPGATSGESNASDSSNGGVIKPAGLGPQAMTLFQTLFEPTDTIEFRCISSDKGNPPRSIAIKVEELREVADLHRPNERRCDIEFPHREINELPEESLCPHRLRNAKGEKLWQARRLGSPCRRTPAL